MFAKLASKQLLTLSCQSKYLLFDISCSEAVILLPGNWASFSQCSLTKNTVSYFVLITLGTGGVAAIVSVLEGSKTAFCLYFVD